MNEVRKSVFPRQETGLFSGVFLVERDRFTAEDSASELLVPFLRFCYLLLFPRSAATCSGEQPVLLPAFQWSGHAASAARFCCLPGRGDCRPRLSLDSHAASQSIAVFFSNMEA